MPKCSRCQENEAILEIQSLKPTGPQRERLCLVCALKDPDPGLQNQLKTIGVTAENVETLTARFNEMGEMVGNLSLDELNQMFEDFSMDDVEAQLEAFGLDPKSMNMAQFESWMTQRKDKDASVLDETEAENQEKQTVEPSNEAVISEQSTLSESPKKDDSKVQNDKAEETSLSKHQADQKTQSQPEKNDQKSGPPDLIETLKQVIQEVMGDDSPDQIMVIPQSRFGNSSDDAVKQTRTADHKQDKPKLKYLDKYGMNLTALAKAGEIEAIVGREKELDRMIQILNRHSKNNPAILGEPGVGKTAMAEGLAKLISEEKVPAKLLEMSVYLLDMTAMVAGTQFRGQFESRMKGVVEEAKACGNIILVIDEMHNIMGAGDAEGAMSAANILKPALARGEIRVIGMTTLEEYRRHIEKDAALERRFQKVVLKEPTEAEAFDILKGRRPAFEMHHHVRYSDDILWQCVRLSNRYIHDRFLPDKAIDIMDEAGSRANLLDTDLVEVNRLKKELEQIASERSAIEAEIAKTNEPSEVQFEKQAQTTQKYLATEAALRDIEARLTPYDITLSDIASVVELWTDIPVQNITEAEAEKLLKLEDRLKSKIIGQDEAVSAVSRAIRRNRAGLAPQDKPASFIFVGPTGVGKTCLVKALSENLFGSAKDLIRLDMSEYMEVHTVSKLIGSPPGYVGYDDAGQLTEKVRRRPYSVILLDEIEKAHQDVFNILLQILDEGRLTDSHGRVVNFKDTVIIMTSNAGTSIQKNGYGFGANGHQAIKDQAMDALKHLFRPEFLNRVDEVIVFDALNEQAQLDILQLMIQELADTMFQQKGIRLKVTEKAMHYLLKKGYSDEYGARPLRKTIQREIEDALAEQYLAHRLDGISAIAVDVDEAASALTFSTL